LWAHIISTALGIWLMAAPAVLEYGDPARANDRIVGPAAATVACVAAWEVTRGLRWINLVLGAWLLLSPWLFGYPPNAFLSTLLTGLALMALSLVKGRTDTPFGGGWRVLWRHAGESPKRGSSHASPVP
jgi:hypothetical protein